MICKDDFLEAIDLLEVQLGPAPSSSEMFERWIEIRLKPIASIPRDRWLKIVEAACNELSYWNQFTSHWILTKSRELARPELKELPPESEIRRGAKCPDHVKVWMAEERQRFLQVPREQWADYWASRSGSEVRDEMHFIRDRLAREGPTPEEALLLGRDPINIASMPVMPSVAERSPPPPSEPTRYVNQEGELWE